jgi:predicted alpha-1,2-mannosidase
MGGDEAFVEKLDSLFAVSSHVTGPNPASDITGRVGQYAHGNEPAHQILYMYNFVGQPWRAHKRISDILYTMYRPTPDGICGNDDSGQMSAWYVMSAMGIFPQMHGNGVYCIGTPMFKDLKMHHPKGTLTILAPQASRENCYVQSLKVNGKPYTKTWFTHEQLFSGDMVLEFEMGAEPNKAWGAAPEDRPRSMRDEKWEE